MPTSRTFPRSRSALSVASFGLGIALVLGGLVPTAEARPVSIEGVVQRATSRWTADGSRIVTESVIATASGEVTVIQDGGTVDGLGMRTLPGAPILAPGMVVAVAARAEADLSARQHLAVDEVQVTGGFEFVRTGPTRSGKPLYWKSGCVEITTDLDGTSDLRDDLEATIVSQSVAEWNGRVASCSYMNLVEKPRKQVEVGRDYANVIKFRDTEWCKPATADAPKQCHSPAAAGITTVSFVNDADSSRDGEIVDADIELNSVHFAISANGQSLGTGACKSDLANTLTHELGHLLGLEHTCLAPGDPARVDDNGVAVPECTSLPANSPIRDTTMYNYQTCGETMKADLTQDEVDAMCVTYPLARDPGTCGAVGSGGEGCCSAQSSAPSSLLLFLATGLLLFLRRRR